MEEAVTADTTNLSAPRMVTNMCGAGLHEAYDYAKNKIKLEVVDSPS